MTLKKKVTVIGCQDLREYEKIREMNIEEREKAMKELLKEINKDKEEMNEHVPKKR